MIKQRILSAYEEMAEKYNELIDHKPHNAYYDRPNTLKLLPEVKGKVVLDAACGPGKYAEILIAKGAVVTGFDISPKMVELAIERNGHNPGQFFEYNFFRSKKYFEVENVKCTWKGFEKPIEVNSFRRPLGACISPLTDNGFYIDLLVELKPTKEFEKLDPRHFKELNEFPSFMCIRALKRRNNGI